MTVSVAAFFIPCAIETPVAHEYYVGDIMINITS